MTQREFLCALVKLCCVWETLFLQMVSSPLFNPVEHRNEYASLLKITRFRGSPKCLNFSHDLDRCVHWSARGKNTCP